MVIFHKASELQKNLSSSATSIGLVPTMGGLHIGHISLIQKAIKDNMRVIVSIYVNPTQFNQSEDLENYPMNIEKDLKILMPFKNNLILYIPNNQEIYPTGISSKKYDFGSLSLHMEGNVRPGHFDGVATIVETLFKKIKPDKAYFGEKDFQQLQIIRALNEKLNLDIEIIGCETVRTSDGLALSSRNSLLSSKQIDNAKVIYETLRYINTMVSDWSIKEMKYYFKSKVEAYEDFKLEYFYVANQRDLIPVSFLDSKKEYRVFISVFAGKTRLIDNIKLFRI
jgi:pantoate--beta-alanine ligase